MIAATTLSETLLLQLLQSAGFFAAILLVLFLLEFFVLNRFAPPPECAQKRNFDRGLLLYSLNAFVILSAATLSLSLASEVVSEWCGLDLPKQNLIQILLSPQIERGAKIAVVLFALFEAPLLEEGIFRRYVFRSLMRLKFVGPVGAMVVSGALFALAHMNAVTFIPLWFLGAALAWVYYRTGRLIVPMTIHFCFNLLNLVLLFLFPEIA